MFERLWATVRLSIEDITIRKGDGIQLDTRRGGAGKTLMLPKPLSFCESHRRNPTTAAENGPPLRRLQLCRVNTGDGLPLALIVVGYVRKAYGLRSQFDRLRRTRFADGP
jgi:hypothetical protein